QGASVPGQPQLPSAGTEVLLFLKNWGDGYMICSASHSVVEVQTTEKGRRVVLSRFEDSEIMTENALRDYQSMHDESGENAILLSDRVPVEELASVFARIARRAG